ncbi:MAG: hypothetical protein N3A66_11560, partial [Planctomycetota bacterium]|nr:hypothetical protein [Planctomycetota bacterium]
RQFPTAWTDNHTIGVNATPWWYGSRETTMREIHHPSQSLFWADTAGVGWNNWGISVFKDWNELGYRHVDAANASFFDEHVKALRPGDDAFKYPWSFPMWMTQ